jgi:hypothetical protein
MQLHPVVLVCLGNIPVRPQLCVSCVQVAQLTQTPTQLLHAQRAQLAPSLLMVKAPADHVRQEQPIKIATLVLRVQHVSRDILHHSRLPRARCVRLAT